MNLPQWLQKFRQGDWQPAVRVPDGPRTPSIRRRYRFSGRVQGVGFRFEAMRFALQLELTGWARNEADGTVTIEIEGAADYIDEFLRVMRAVPRFDITEIRTEDLPVKGTETKFEARY